MKKAYSVLLILFICCQNTIFAQISQGGIPLFLNHTLLRSSSVVECIEMPPFNVDSVKQIDDLNKENMRASFQFAYKFYTRIEKGKQGNRQVLADGTKVWQVSIRSKDAYSINLLFTRFRLPEGGKLFLYNADRSHVIGAFDHKNNSPENILPVRPVAGDVITVEYSEPANVAFEGELIIGEVNHDYRDIMRAGEPGVDVESSFTCMPDVLYSDADERIIRSTVLLMINGSVMCTGSLVNNTNNNERPYLLTAVHCLNGNFTVTNPDYVSVAGTVIAFFNYNRPVREIQMKATEEMSLAGAHPCAIIAGKDVALLEFKDKPPVHYNAYYAGWNMRIDNASSLPPYTNIHHPNGSVKKFGQSNKNLHLVDWGALFDKNSHLELPSWDIGSTHLGSSGSPLFDKDYRIVGTLTGGDTSCSNVGVGRDFFTALFQSWEDTNPNLKSYLNPAQIDTLRYDGYDPHAQNPLFRINNADYKNGDQVVNATLSGANSGFLFGNNSLNIEAFAEEFNLNQTAEILGVYVLIPKMPFTNTDGVDIEIYEGANSPEKLLDHKLFVPQYRYYNDKSFHEGNKNTTNHPTETFVTFDNPVNVDRKFFIAYKTPSGKQFSVYNTQFAAAGKANSAWIKSSQGWVKASDFTPQPTTTSLALHPLIRYTKGTSIPEAHKETIENVHYNRLSGQLSLDSETKSDGEIFVYTLSGQLIEQIPFSKGEKLFKLNFRPKGSLGIVKIIQERRVISKKIFY
jgi:hypothetical protein